jgi:prefoldin subunit 5
MAAPPVPQVDEAQQVQALKTQAEYLTEALNDVRDRIEELQSAKDAPE